MTVAGGGTPPGARPPGFADDYEALRTDVGSVTLARDVLRVSGPDALEYLQGQLSQDVAALGRGESADSLILTPQGKLDALVRVTRAGDDELYIDVDAGFGQMVAARLARFKLRVKVDIEPMPWRGLALRGPRSAEVSAGLATSDATSLTAEFAWNGVSGVDLLGESPVSPDGVQSCSVEAWEAVRVEAGIPVMGAELDERTIAAEADLLDRSVSFTKGCYTGQELVARLDARGNRVARRLRGLVVVGSTHEPAGVPQVPAALALGSEIVFEGKVVGSVTSSAWSPGLHCPIALGYVHRTVESGLVDVRAVAPQAPDGADGPTVVAEVRALPLV